MYHNIMAIEDESLEVTKERGVRKAVLVSLYERYRPKVPQQGWPHEAGEDPERIERGTPVDTSRSVFSAYFPADHSILLVTPDIAQNHFRQLVTQTSRRASYSWSETIIAFARNA
jgi:hypothetical protein